jgi:hypothetical protein
MSHVSETEKDRRKDGGWKFVMVTGLKAVFCEVCFEIEERAV